MMHWNHRVIKRTYGDDVQYAIVEAHYNDAGELTNVTLDDIAPYGDDLDGLRWTLEMMLKALDAPVLEDGKIEFAEDDV